MHAQSIGPKESQTRALRTGGLAAMAAAISGDAPKIKANGKGGNPHFDGPAGLDRARPEVQAAVSAAAEQRAKNPTSAPAPTPPPPKPAEPAKGGAPAPAQAKAPAKGKATSTKTPAKGKASKAAKAKPAKAAKVAPAKAIPKAAKPADEPKRSKYIPEKYSQPRGAFNAEATDTLIALLKRATGVTEAEAIKACGWEKCGNPARRVRRFMSDVAENYCGLKVTATAIKGGGVRYTAKAK